MRANHTKLGLLLALTMAYSISTLTARHNPPSFHANGRQFGLETMSINIETDDTLARILDELNVNWEEATAFMVYIAGFNDLGEFAIKNLQEMASVGSNENLVIAVHLDVKIRPNKKITRWYLILKDKLLHLNAHIPWAQAMDSGSPRTLLSFCRFCAEHFPAKYTMLELWNHGTGAIDPNTGRLLQASELFTINPTTHLLELNRSESFLDRIELQPGMDRGICWDDSTGHYLTNNDLQQCFSIISNEIFKKKLDIIGFDACLMSMLEVADIFKDHANIMVSSQEVILGPGWNYHKVLFPFQFHPLTPKQFAQHIVNMYELTYHNITQDYTLSALDLSKTVELKSTIDKLAKNLIELLRGKHAKKVKRAIHQAKARQSCTHFDERSYKDLHHLLSNLHKELGALSLHDSNTKQLVKSTLNNIQKARATIHRMTIANVKGSRVPRAKGISLYFPERHKMHESYANSPFGKTNGWKDMIRQYLAT